MDSLQDIIAQYGKPEEPELLILKRYIDEHYHTPVGVSISGNAIVVTVPSAALANTLRFQGIKIQKACQLKKRLLFRIG